MYVDRRILAFNRSFDQKWPIGFDLQLEPFRHKKPPSTLSRVASRICELWLTEQPTALILSRRLLELQECMFHEHIPKRSIHQNSIRFQGAIAHPS